MNRIIKFRGQRVDTKEWVYGFLMYRQSDGVYFIAPQDSYESFIVDENTVGQFTGLHDKNGKEIYDGDYVRQHDEELQVYWNATMAAYDIMHEGGDSEPMINNFWDSTSLEVTGNIHQTRH